MIENKKIEVDEMKFHHLGIATADILEMQEYLKQITRIADMTDVVYDEQQQAYLCMVTLSDGTQIELIAGAMVEKLVKKRNFLYHTCFEVMDLEKKIACLVRNGALVVSEPKEAVLFGLRRVAFLATEMGLIELLEHARSKKKSVSC